MQSYFNQLDADKAYFQPLLMSSSGRLDKGLVYFIRKVTKLVWLNNTIGAGESRPLTSIYLEMESQNHSRMEEKELVKRKTNTRRYPESAATVQGGKFKIRF